MSLILAWINVIAAALMIAVAFRDGGWVAAWFACTSAFYFCAYHAEKAK